MARYRKINVAMYADGKFASLSKPQPSAQWLWVYLLTGPHTTVIPGVSCVGEAGLAESLGWELEAFREVFREVSAKGMAKADWKARLVWVPNAVKYNPPESQNVVKAWAKMWPEVPECRLKVEAQSALKAFVEGLGEGWIRVFDQTFPHPSGNQEQEQEQEQENTPQPPRGGRGVVAERQSPQKSPKGDADLPPGFVRFWATYPAHERKVGKSECVRIWRRRKLEAITGQVVASLERCKASRGWTKNGGEFIPGPASWLNKTPWETDPAEQVGAAAQAGDSDPDGFVAVRPDPSELPWNRGGAR